MLSQRTNDRRSVQLLVRIALSLGFVATGCVPMPPGADDPASGGDEVTCRCREDAQVMLESRFLIVQESFLNDVGVDFDVIFETEQGSPTNARYGPAPFTNDAPAFVSALPNETELVLDSLDPPATEPAQGLSPFGAILNPNDVDQVLDALSGDDTLLSAPSVVTLFGQSAFIMVSNESQFLTDLEPNFESALRDIDELINPVTVGVTVEVTPRVDQDDTIIMDVRPSTGAVFNTPETPDSRLLARGSELTTTVRVADGETVVLGGVVDDTGATTDSTVPLLANVPLIGRTFDDRTHVHEDSNLIVLITASIVRDAEP